MTDEQQLVLHFTQTFNVPYPDIPTIPGPDICTLRMTLLEEELEELKEAYANEDLVKIADGLGDLLYVTYGAAIACGMSLRPHLSLAPSENYTLIPVPEFTERMDKFHVTFSFLRTIFTHGNTYHINGSYYRAYLQKTLELLQEVIYNTAAVLHLDLKPIFDEIHRSNMTKLWEDGLPRIREDGKILKPPTYTPPDLTPLVEQQTRR